MFTLVWAKLKNVENGRNGYLTSINSKLYLLYNGRYYPWNDLIRRKGNFNGLAYYEYSHIRKKDIDVLSFSYEPGSNDLEIEEWAGCSVTALPVCEYSEIDKLVLKKWIWGFENTRGFHRADNCRFYVLSADTRRGIVYYDLAFEGEILTERKGKYLNIVGVNNKLEYRNHYTDFYTSFAYKRTATTVGIACYDVLMNDIPEHSCVKAMSRKYVVDAYKSNYVTEMQNPHEWSFRDNRYAINVGYGNFGKNKYSVAMMDILATYGYERASRTNNDSYSVVRILDGFKSRISDENRIANQVTTICMHDQTTYCKRVKRLGLLHDMNAFRLMYRILPLNQIEAHCILREYLRTFFTTQIHEKYKGFNYPDRREICSCEAFKIFAYGTELDIQFNQQWLNLATEALYADIMDISKGYISAVLKTLTRNLFGVNVGNSVYDYIITQTEQGHKTYDLFLFCLKARYGVLNTPFEHSYQITGKHVQPYMGKSKGFATGMYSFANDCQQDPYCKVFYKTVNNCVYATGKVDFMGNGYMQYMTYLVNKAPDVIKERMYTMLSKVNSFKLMKIEGKSL